MLNPVETVLPAERTLYRVVLVSKHPSWSHTLETILETTPCDVVFVESTAHAYSQIKRVAPDLVIVCLEIDDRNGFHALSMLKLDRRTREIPVIVCAAEPEADGFADRWGERDERVFIESQAAFPMS